MHPRSPGVRVIGPPHRDTHIPGKLILGGPSNSPGGIFKNFAKKLPITRNPRVRGSVKRRTADRGCHDRQLHFRATLTSQARARVATWPREPNVPVSATCALRHQHTLDLTADGFLFGIRGGPRQRLPMRSRPSPRIT